jgi:putative transposase
MARLPRVVIPGCPHHLIQRGNRRQNVFFSDEDRAFYLILLKRQLDKFGVALWAFCLMANHVHMVAVPRAKESFARAIGEVHRQYTSVINTRENWKGYLWQGRFITYPLSESHLFAAIRYVERNPVRAGLIERAEDYAWSSARAHVRRESHPLLTPCPMETSIPDWSSYLGQSDRAEDIELFVRHASNGRPLGNDEFLKHLEALTGRVLMPQKRGRKKLIGE